MQPASRLRYSPELARMAGLHRHIQPPWQILRLMDWILSTARMRVSLEPSLPLEEKIQTSGSCFFLAPIARSSYNALAVTVNERAKHPVRGILSTDLTVSYTYSHFTGTGTSVDTQTGPLASGGDQEFGETVLNLRNPNQAFGPNSLDRHQQLSIGLDAEVWKGFRIDTIAHHFLSRFRCQPKGPATSSSVT
jgi:hypothetical protein